MRNLPVVSLLALLLVSFAGCGWLPALKDETADWSAQKLYSEARASLGAGDYARAIQLYESLESRHPFGGYAQQALLEIAYAYHKSGEPDSALAAADRFIRTYPLHPNVDYVYYLKGLVNFNRGRGLVERYLPQDPAERDPGAALQSFQDFSELVNRFPDSRYAVDAAQRMTYLRNNLAQYEVNVGNFYLRRGAYLAAANRGKYVVEGYPRTPAVPAALVIMIKAYQRLELEELAGDALRVLKLNYPDHPGLAEVERLSAR